MPGLSTTTRGHLVRLGRLMSALQVEPLAKKKERTISAKSGASTKEGDKDYAKAGAGQLA